MMTGNQEFVGGKENRSATEKSCSLLDSPSPSVLALVEVLSVRVVGG